MQYEKYRKHTSITLVMIMVAGGLTFAIPGADPAFAEVTTSNPHLYVSAEGQDPDNKFAEGNIIEVIIRDDSIGDTDGGEAEPEVTVNGADLRMLQTVNGDWRAYFMVGELFAYLPCPPDVSCERPSLVPKQLDYGVFCSAREAAGLTGLDLSYTIGVFIPATLDNRAHEALPPDLPGHLPANICSSPFVQSTEHPLIREAPDLTGHTLGDLWPFIQVLHFTPHSDLDIEYNKGGNRETVSLMFTDPQEIVSLDRGKYPRGASVHISIEDYALNIDPTDEDVWTFATGPDGTAAYYNHFDEGGELLNYEQVGVTSHNMGGFGGLSIVRNAQGGAPLIDCRTTSDFGILGDGSDFLVSDENGICVVNENGAAGDVFAPGNLTLNFVEDGPNNNTFINWAEDKLSNLVVRDGAARNTSFQIKYGASGYVSGAVGHFLGELSLDVPDDAWNPGERIGVTLTDGDNNVNPLDEDDLSVADSGSLAIPSIRIGYPVTLASVGGPVEWHDLYDEVPDATAPVITLLGANPAWVEAGSNYTDAGAVCIDNDDPNPVLTINSPVDTAMPGVYTVTYTCTDASGNSERATRTVIVGDALVLHTVTAGDWADGRLMLNVTGKTTLPGVMLDSDARINGLPMRISAEFGTGNIDDTVTIRDISVRGETEFYLTAGDVQSNTRAVDIPRALDLTSVTIALDENDDEPTYWREGTINLNVTGTVGVSDAKLVTSDGILVAADVPITNATTSSIDGLIELDNISLAGKTVQFELSSGGVSYATADATYIPAILRLDDVAFSVAAERWSEGVLALTVDGSENVTNSESIDSINLIARTADGYMSVGDVSVSGTFEDTLVQFTDIRMRGNTEFRLNYTDAGGNNTMSNPQTLNIPKILDLDTVKRPDNVATFADWQWSATGLALDILGVANVTADGANPITLTINGAETETTVNDLFADGVTVNLLDSTLAGQPVQFGVTYTDTNDRTVTDTISAIRLPSTDLNLVSVTPSVWDNGKLSLTVEGNTGNIVQAGVELLVNDATIGLAVTNGTGGVITTVDDLSDISVSGMTNFTLRTGSAATNTVSNTVQADVPPAFAIESVTVTSGWGSASSTADATLPLRVTGYENVSGAVDIGTYSVVDNLANDLDISIVDAITGAINANVALADVTYAPLSNQEIQIYLEAIDGTRSDNYTLTVPSALVMYDLAVPDSWNVLGKLPVEVRGASFLPAAYDSAVLAMYTSMDAADESNLDLAPFPVVNVNPTRNADGSLPITGSLFLENAALSGNMIYFRLQATDGTNTVHSEMYRVTLPARASGNGADALANPTPASLTPYDRFPPITGAVIGSVSSDMPAIHQALKVITPHAMDRIAHTFEMEVEPFSDRLRLAEPPTDLNITGTSKLVIKNWEEPTFAAGVTTLFNWNLDSLASHGADITGIFLANGTHKIPLAEGSSGLKDITGMQAELAMLGGGDRHLVITLSGDVPHLREDVVLVADFFTFGQNDGDGRVNNAIYRIELEESGTNSADYKGTIEYARLNQLNSDDPAAYASLRPVSDQISIIVHEDFTGEDSVRVNYLDLGADGASAPIGVQMPPFEMAPATNQSMTVAFRDDPYAASVGQRVQIVADLTNGQDRAQGFIYIVQILDADGATVALSRITNAVGAGQTLSPSASWIPTEAGTYSATAFVWEPVDNPAAQALKNMILTQGAAFVWDSVDNPAALSPPVTTTITVS